MIPSADRLEVRLDRERRRRLLRLAQARQASASEVIRALIDLGYEELASEERRQAVAAIAEFTIEDVPEPETLKQQIEGAYELPDLR